MNKITQISRAYHNVELGKFGEYICNLTGYEKFFPSNGGCEGCEAAIKFARRWGYVVKKVPDNQASVIMAKNNFWGRSITASGACDDPSRYTAFGPFTPGFPLVDFNDVQAIEDELKANPNTVAVYLEPIQGEGGIIMPEPGYLKKVKALCKKYNALLIADEVQTGFGRTGYLFAYEHDMIDEKPDILIFAKSVSGGFYPVSGILADAHIIDLVKAGEHGSTFGGNPLGMAIAKRAVEVLVEEGMVENSRKMGEYLMAGLKSFKSPLIHDIRGRGLFQGLEVKNGLKVDGNDLSYIMFYNGMLTKATHERTVRLSPALVINKEEID
jgi:ornithine--oxo-acid transaminase